ncbi:MAG: DUF4920 domain-containing protein [Adhaeribacter sp.]
MKKCFFFLFMLATALVQEAAAQQPASKGKTYGQAFSPKSVVAAQDLPRLLGKQDSLTLQVRGKVREVCQVKGCWMDIALADNTVMKVRFKDYAFFMPKDLKGKTVILQGMARQEIVSVADQRHYAKDAGKSQELIQAITKPKQSITYTASGVLVQ